MRRYTYILLTMTFMVITFSPGFYFAYLKYFGIAGDVEWLPDEPTEEVAEAGCKIVLRLDNFAKVYPVEQELCAVIICTAQGCGIKGTNDGEEVFYVQDLGLTDSVNSAFAEISNEEVTEEEVAPEEEDESGVQTEDEEEFFSKYQYALWQWLSIFSVAIGFSLLGIITSVISRRGVSAGGNLSRNASGFIVVYFMACASGLVAVALFAGGFLQGNMFPTFTGAEANFGFNSWSALKFRGDDWFQLAIWCYIAGFYERFIPQVLDQVMKRAAEEDKGIADEASGGKSGDPEMDAAKDMLKDK